MKTINLNNYMELSSKNYLAQIKYIDDVAKLLERFINMKYEEGKFMDLKAGAPSIYEYVSFKDIIDRRANYYYNHRRPIVKGLRLYKAFFINDAKDEEFINAIISFLDVIKIKINTTIDMQEYLEKYDININLTNEFDFDIYVNTMKYLDKKYFDVNVFTITIEDASRKAIIIEYTDDNTSNRIHNIINISDHNIPIYTNLNALRILYVAYILMYQLNEYYEGLFKTAKTYFEPIDMLQKMEGL
jgi:hypothetical protein